MITSTLVVIIIVAIVGLVAKFIVDKKSFQYEISWREFGIVMAVISFIVAPGSNYLGWQMAKNNKMTFVENLNGWETQALTRTTECERDGSCRWEYDCDPYIVSYSCMCNDKGVCQTCYRTDYHSCPYVDAETDYLVDTTLGEFLIGENRFPLNPQARRWRESEEIPASIIDRAGVGEPQFWTEVAERIKSGYPGPVTKRADYPNYIYASDKTILLQYSSQVEEYKKKGLLPVPQKSVYSHYLADRVYAVKAKIQNLKEWQKEVGYFNSELGMRLQGDLHVVIAGADVISNPDEYALTIKSYWQNKQYQEKNTISKNSIYVILFTDGEKITWARTLTGMPLGNEKMTVAADNRLKGLSLDPAIVVGKIRRHVDKTGTHVEKNDGALLDVLFGISDKSTAFKRISMSAKDNGDNGSGFLYLKGEIRPNKDQLYIVYICSTLFCCLGWVVAIFVGEKTNHFNFRK